MQTFVWNSFARSFVVSKHRTLPHLSYCFSIEKDFHTRFPRLFSATAALTAGFLQTSCSNVSPSSGQALLGWGLCLLKWPLSRLFSARARLRWSLQDSTLTTGCLGTLSPPDKSARCKHLSFTEQWGQNNFQAREKHVFEPRNYSDLNNDILEGWPQKMTSTFGPRRCPVRISFILGANYPQAPSMLHPFITKCWPFLKKSSERKPTSATTFVLHEEMATVRWLSFCSSRQKGACTCRYVRAGPQCQCNFTELISRKSLDVVVSELV